MHKITALIDRWHWVMLALAAPFLLFPSPARSPALLVVPGLWIALRLAGYQPLPSTPFNGTLLLLNLMVLVSLYATYDVTVSLPSIAGMILGMGVFFAFAYYGQHARGWRLCLLAFLAAGVGVAVLGLMGTQWINKVSFLSPLMARLPTRLISLPGDVDGLHPNRVAGALLWIIPIFLTLSTFAYTHFDDWLPALKQRCRIMITLLLAGLTLLVTSTFLLTQSRGGYLAFALAGLLMFAVALPRQQRWLLAGCIVIIILLAAGFAWRYGISIIAQAVFERNLQNDPLLSLNTLEGRLDLWSRAIYGIQDFPFTGMGMNTFRRVVHVLYPLFLVGPDTDIGHAHNEFLQVALDLGIPGLIAFIALYMGAFCMLRAIWMSNQGDKNQLKRFLALGLGGGLLAHMLYGLTDAIDLGARPGVPFWMLLGLIAGLYQQKLSREREH